MALLKMLYVISRLVTVVTIVLVFRFFCCMSFAHIKFIFSTISCLSSFALVLLALFSWRRLCAGRLHYPVSEALLI